MSGSPCGGLVSTGATATHRPGQQPRRVGVVQDHFLLRIPADFAAGADRDYAQLGDRVGQTATSTGATVRRRVRTLSRKFPMWLLLSYRRISFGSDLLLQQPLGFGPQAAAGEVYFAAIADDRGSVPARVKWKSTPPANLPLMSQSHGASNRPARTCPVPRTRPARTGVVAHRPDHVRQRMSAPAADEAVRLSETQ